MGRFVNLDDPKGVKEFISNKSVVKVTNMILRRLVSITLWSIISSELDLNMTACISAVLE